MLTRGTHLTCALSLTAATLAFGGGCAGESIGYTGVKMFDHFPLDGERHWEYSNEAYEYGIEVDMTSASEDVNDAQVHTFTYTKKDVGDLLMTTRWSSDSFNGILLHGYEWLGDEGGGEDTGGEDSGGARGPIETMTFDPPVILAERNMVAGESVVTETGGMTFTSTFEISQECENIWVGGDATWDCVRVVLDDGDGDADSGVKVAGTYWLAPRFGMSWFQLTGDADKWILTTASTDFPD